MSLSTRSLRRVMNYTASTTTDFETVVQPNEPVPLISEETLHSKIKCLDCPGRLHSPGPGMSIDNFQIHLKSRLHREKVPKSVEVIGQQPHNLQAKTLVAPAEVSSIRTPKERHITQASVGDAVLIGIFGDFEQPRDRHMRRRSTIKFRTRFARAHSSGDSVFD